MAFTFVFGTGFEMGTSLTTFASVTEGATGIITTDFHTGIRCHYAKNWYLHVKNGIGLTTMSQFSMGFWLNRTGSKKLNFILDDGKILYLIPNVTTGLLELYIDGVLSATGHLAVTSGQWINIQIDATIGNSGSFEVRLNGIDDLSFSGDTQPGTSAYLRDVYFEWAAELGKAYYIDDLTFGYGGFPGDRRYDPLYVDGDGSIQEWDRGVSTQAEPSAPTLTESTATNPQLNGTYYYYISFVDDLGEVLGVSHTANITVTNKRVLLSNIPLGNANTTARRIWRTKAGGSDYFLLYILDNNTTTTYTDNNNDSILDTSPPDGEHPLSPDEHHYLNVWDVPPYDYTFLYTKTDGQTELFTFTNWDGTDKEVLGLILWCKGNKNTADTQQLKFVLVSGSTTDEGDAKDVDVPLSYVYDHYLVDPDTSAAWTESGINAIEAGMKSVIP